MQCPKHSIHCAPHSHVEDWDTRKGFWRSTLYSKKVLECKRGYCLSSTALNATTPNATEARRLSLNDASAAHSAPEGHTDRDARYASTRISFRSR